MKNMIISLFLFLFSAIAVAEEKENFVQDGFLFTMQPNNSVSISDVGDGSVALPVSEDGTLVIPSMVEYNGRTYSVDYIQYGAFAYRPEIKHLIVSEGIEGMGGCAFYRCTNLQSVHLPSTFTAEIVQGQNVLFDGCCHLEKISVAADNKKYDSRDNCNAIILTDDDTMVLACVGTKLPAGILSIGSQAYSLCEKQETIVVPHGVKRIEPMAFKNCAHLKKVLLPNTLEEIGYNAFSNCVSLESIHIPQNVSRIIGHQSNGAGQYWNLFGGCYNLKEVTVDQDNKTFDSRNQCNAVIDSKTNMVVAACGNSTIPPSVKGIKAYAFTASSILRIEIPENVTQIDEGAFWNCQFLASISVSRANPVYNSQNDCNAIIETATGNLLQGCSQTRIPDGVKTIGKEAFQSVSLSPYFIIPEGVEEIGEGAFQGARGVRNIQMPSTLKVIKENAFSGCKDLEYVDMKACSPQVEMGAFGHCKRLGAVDFSPTSGKIDPMAFSHSLFEQRVKSLQEIKE